MKNQSKGGVLIWVLVVLLVVVAGWAGYYVWRNYFQKTQPTKEAGLPEKAFDASLYQKVSVKDLKAEPEKYTAAKQAQTQELGKAGKIQTEGVYASGPSLAVFEGILWVDQIKESVGFPKVKEEESVGDEAGPTKLYQVKIYATLEGLGAYGNESKFSYRLLVDRLEMVKELKKGLTQLKATFKVSGKKKKEFNYTVVANYQLFPTSWEVMADSYTLTAGYTLYNEKGTAVKDLEATNPSMVKTPFEVKTENKEAILYVDYGLKASESFDSCFYNSAELGKEMKIPLEKLTAETDFSQKFSFDLSGKGGCSSFKEEIELVFDF